LEKKELFHKQFGQLPFEQKIRILIRLQEIADSIPKSHKKKQMSWKIF
jgi:hypothetical protein